MFRFFGDLPVYESYLYHIISVSTYMGVIPVGLAPGSGGGNSAREGLPSMLLRFPPPLPTHRLARSIDEFREQVIAKKGGKGKGRRWTH